MKLVLYLALLNVLIPGCKESDPNFKYKKLEDFKFRKANITEGTKIKILSFSGGPVCTPEETYYFQYIGVSMETSDTVRILSPCQQISNEVHPTEGSFTPWEKMSKYIEEAMERSGDKSFESTNKIVVFNKNNMELEGQDFKTAIGTLSY